MDLSIIIVSYNTKDYLRNCLKSIYDQTKGISFEVFVVDNASFDGSAQMVEKEFQKVRLIKNTTNSGFAKANNQAFRLCRGRNILLLNPDTEVQTRSLETMMEFLDSSTETGAVCGKLLNPDGTLQRYYNRFPTITSFVLSRIFFRRFFLNSRMIRSYNMEDCDFEREMMIEQPSGACIMLKRKLISTKNLMDEQFPLFFNDVDLCKRIYSYGYNIFFLPSAKVIHHKGASLEKSNTLQKNHLIISFIRYLAKHHSPVKVIIVTIIFYLDTVIRTFYYFLKNMFNKKERKEVNSQIQCFKNLLSRKLPEI